jgi:hypothetical protein
VGNYALKPFFSDGHESGLYTWTYLYELGSKQEALWADYLARLAAAGVDRDTPMPARPAAAAAARAVAVAAAPRPRPPAVAAAAAVLRLRRRSRNPFVATAGTWTPYSSQFSAVL